MKRDSIGYRLYVKYNADNPAKIRSKEEMFNKSLNGLVDSAVWKWAEPIVVEHFEGKGKIKVNANGESWLLD